MQTSKKLDKTGRTMTDLSSQPDRVDTNMGSKRILIVDDEEPIAWLLEEGLSEMFSCEVMIATRGDQALQLYHTTFFDLVITDYKMPGMNGLTLAQHIRQARPQARIIMLTAYGSDGLTRQAGEVGIQYVLIKPIKLSELRGLVGQLLDRQEDRT